MIAHQSKFYENNIEHCIDLGRKYACFSEWFRSHANMKVSLHVKDVGLRRKKTSGFSFKSRSSMERKNSSGRVMRMDKENVVFGSVRSKGLGKKASNNKVKSGKRQRKEFNDAILFGNLQHVVDMVEK